MAYFKEFISGYETGITPYALFLSNESKLTQKHLYFTVFFFIQQLPRYQKWITIIIRNKRIAIMFIK